MERKIAEMVVGAAGIEPATPTMSTLTPHGKPAENREKLVQDFPFRSILVHLIPGFFMGARTKKEPRPEGPRRQVRMEDGEMEGAAIAISLAIGVLSVAGFYSIGYAVRESDGLHPLISSGYFVGGFAMLVAAMIAALETTTQPIAPL